MALSKATTASARNETATFHHHLLAMKRFLFIIIILSLGKALSAQEWSDTLYALSYNTQHCKGADDSVNVSRTAQVISRLQPDIVAVQELDSICTRSGKTYQLEQLAQQTGLTGTFAKAIDFQGGAYGVGILSKETPLSVKRIPLPGAEARVLLICEFKNYAFACTHLDLHEENRLQSLSIILREASISKKPFFIAGDWNDEPDSNFMQLLRNHFLILNYDFAPTFSAQKPEICIDYIAGYLPGLRIHPISTEVVDEPNASDHRPLLCKFQLK